MRASQQPTMSLLAQAYLVFSRIGSPNAQAAAGALVQACGLEEAAEACLAQFGQEDGNENDSENDNE